MYQAYKSHNHITHTPTHTHTYKHTPIRTRDIAAIATLHYQTCLLTVLCMLTYASLFCVTTIIIGQIIIINNTILNSGTKCSIIFSLSLSLSACVRLSQTLLCVCAKKRNRKLGSPLSYTFMFDINSIH